MAMLPFYISGHPAPKLIIVGGGYAGLAAMVNIYRYCPGAQVILMDPLPHHIKIIHLHETFRRPFSDFFLPFSILEQRFGCRHVQTRLEIDENRLQQWQRERCIDIGDEILDFDYLLITVGAGFARFDAGNHVLDLGDFTTAPGPQLLEKAIAGNPGELVLSVVGGGATGVQFLFEIDHFLRARQANYQLRLIDGEESVLRQFTPDFSRYVLSRMTDLGIEFFPRSFFRRQSADSVTLEHRDTGESVELPGTLSLLFLGKQPTIYLEANAFGQVIVKKTLLKNIFSAGDCAHLHSLGTNAMTAQSAVRKGKLAARNVLRHSGLVKFLEPYLHRDIGYVVSLGPADAIGWIGVDRNVVAGFPALLIKEIVEAQYDLLLAGVDTYLV